MRINLKIIGFLTCLASLVSAQENPEFVWPNGAKAAICLTYDDGLPSHVNTVVPMLNKYNFKGSFYPTVVSKSVYEQMDKWRALAKDGHELGNHTVYHPCRKSVEGMEWVKAYLDLDHYTKDQIIEEIEAANSFLLAIDGQKKRTFAYPCAHSKAGGQSYKEALHSIVSAARDSRMEIKLAAKLSEIDLYNVPSWSATERTAAELIAYIDLVIANKTLSAITFHGVGAEHLRVTKKSHEEMLQYLHANRDKIWVTTLQAATDYLKTNLIQE